MLRNSRDRIAHWKEPTRPVHPIPRSDHLSVDEHYGEGIHAGGGTKRPDHGSAPGLVAEPRTPCIPVGLHDTGNDRGMSTGASTLCTQSPATVVVGTRTAVAVARRVVLVVGSVEVDASPGSVVQAAVVAIRVERASTMTARTATRP